MKTTKDWKIVIIWSIYHGRYNKETVKNETNYRCITLGSTVGKLYARTLENMLRKEAEHTLEGLLEGP